MFLSLIGPVAALALPYCFAQALSVHEILIINQLVSCSTSCSCLLLYLKLRVVCGYAGSGTCVFDFALACFYSFEVAQCWK